jgi:hypothetical protein
MNTKNVCYFDIEADNLLRDATTIWCIVAKMVQKYYIYTVPTDFAVTYPSNSVVTHDIQEWLELVKGTVLAGHNIISYDLPLLHKLHGYEYRINPEDMVDTHILSTLYNPDRLGHSLGFFGEMLRFPKGDHSDWSCFSQEMLDYCIRDVDLVEAVDHFLQQEGGDWDWSEAIKLEYNVWHIQTKQELHGVLFDAPKAEDMLFAIDTEIHNLETDIRSQVPLFPKDMGELKKVFLKNGEYTAPVKNWMELAYS